MKNMTASLIAIMVILALILVSLLYVFFTRRGSSVTPSNQQNQISTAPEISGSQPSPTAHLVQIPFDYEVKTVSGNDLLLTGKEGELGISNSAIVQVFKGSPENAAPAQFSDLKVGQKLIVQVAPRVSVKLFIVSE